MALCVLLADESATIKKVMQITLQDFDAEIRCVNLGTDVAEVAKDFKPDIIFIDILLQKKSGYDVAKELKADPECRTIPLIMLWNGFMEFDEEKFRDSMADDKLEKPFDSESLRKMISQYVPKLQTSPIAEHIEPPPIDWQEETTNVDDDEATNALPMDKLKSEATEKEDAWTMDSFDDLPSLDQISEEVEKDSEEDEDDDNFQPLKLDELPDEQKEKEKSISRFTLNIPKEDLEDFAIEEGSDDNQEIDTSNFLWGNDVTSSIEKKEDADKDEQADLANIESSSQTTAAAEKITNETEKLSQENLANNISKPNMSDAELEAYVREHCQATIEKLAREMVPDLAKKMIQQEIDRLLKEEADA